MTVKSLPDYIKNELADTYLEKQHTQEQIAIRFETSERTVRRVLDEQGIDVSKRALAKRKKEYLTVLQRFDISPTQLEQALIAYSTPVNHAETVLSQHSALRVAQLVWRRFMNKRSASSNIKALTFTSDKTNAPISH